MLTGDHLTVQLDPRLRENSLGDWEGQSWADVRREDDKRVREWLTDCTASAPAGERCVLTAVSTFFHEILCRTVLRKSLSPHSLRSGSQRFFRVGAALEAIARRHLGETVIVVTHGGPIQGAYHLATGQSFSCTRPLQARNCSLHTIQWSPRETAHRHRRPRPASPPVSPSAEPSECPWRIAEAQFREETRSMNKDKANQRLTRHPWFRAAGTWSAVQWDECDHMNDCDGSRTACAYE